MKELTGPLIVLTSVILYSFIPPLLKKASLSLPPFTMMAIAMAVLFSGSFILSMLLENSLKIKLVENKDAVFILILMGVLNLIAFWLAILGYKYMPLWQQSMYSLLIPVLAGIFAYYLLGEALNPKLFIGLIVMGIGLFIAIR